MREILEVLERYYDAVPRLTGTAEAFGSVTLFVPEPSGMPFYQRPTLGRPGLVDCADVRAALRRQRELGLPRAAEWVAQTTPSMGAAVAAAGMTVHEYPLLVLREAVPASPTDLTTRTLRADDDDLVRAVAVQDLGFAHPGTGRGEPADAALAAKIAELDGSPRLARTRRRIGNGDTVVVAAYDGDALIAGGAHNPAGGTSEIIGVATLPAARRRGAAGAVTARLVADARERGVGTIFLSADSDDVARIYRRVGFEPVATAMTAELL